MNTIAHMSSHQWHAHGHSHMSLAKSRSALASNVTHQSARALKNVTASDNKYDSLLALKTPQLHSSFENTSAASVEACK